MGRLSVIVSGVVVAIVVIAGCDSSGTSSSSITQTPPTVDGLVATAKGMQRVLKRDDFKTLRTMSSASCSRKIARSTRAFPVATGKTVPSVLVTVRHFTRKHAEARIRLHYSYADGTGSGDGGWLPFRYEHGGWRFAC